MAGYRAHANVVPLAAISMGCTTLVTSTFSVIFSARRYSTVAGIVTGGFSAALVGIIVYPSCIPHGIVYGIVFFVFLTLVGAVGMALPVFFARFLGPKQRAAVVLGCAGLLSLGILLARPWVLYGGGPAFFTVQAALFMLLCMGSAKQLLAGAWRTEDGWLLHDGWGRLATIQLSQITEAAKGSWRIGSWCFRVPGLAYVRTKARTWTLPNFPVDVYAYGGGGPEIVDEWHRTMIEPTS